MAYSDITASQIEVGKANRKELWTKVKDNFSDLDARSTALEAASTKILAYNGAVINLAQYAGVGTTGILGFFRAPQNMNITQARFRVVKAGTSGTAQMDVTVGASSAVDVSIFSTKPSAAFSAGDNFDTINQVISNASVSEGAFIFFSFDTIQIGMGIVYVEILGEPA